MLLSHIAQKAKTDNNISANSVKDQESLHFSLTHPWFKEATERKFLPKAPYSNSYRCFCVFRVWSLCFSHPCLKRSFLHLMFHPYLLLSNWTLCNKILKGVDGAWFLIALLLCQERFMFKLWMVFRGLSLPLSCLFFQMGSFFGLLYLLKLHNFLLLH